MIFHSGERVVFIGDSVTEYGRRQPVGEGPACRRRNGRVRGNSQKSAAGYGLRCVDLLWHGTEYI